MLEAAKKKLYPYVLCAKIWYLFGKGKAPIFSPEKVQTKVLPICLQIIPMDRRRSGTVGTKFSFVFVFELYRYKVGQNH